jgi:cytochrome c oxidase subunit 3
MSDSHPAHLAHQFDDVEQQKQSSMMGMWIFLVTEVMFFGGLFLGYTVYRIQYPEAWIVGSHMLQIEWGGFNTIVLLASSLTMAFAVRSAQVGRQKAIAGWLIATMILGAAFLGVKVIEYGGKIDHHLVPGPNFDNTLHYAHAGHGEKAGFEKILLSIFGEKPTAGQEGGHVFQEALAKADPRQVQIFYSFYFCMTGMHAIHMIVGEGILLVMLIMTYRGYFSKDYYNPVEITGLYWHFVDIVWIFLFPLLYLIGRH